MATQERLVDRGRRLAREALIRIGGDLRAARIDRGLSVDSVAVALGLSNAHVSRIERGLAPGVPIAKLVRFATLVGLDLVVRTYPGPRALRDAGQVGLLHEFGSRIHASLRWGVEVPLPIAGDQRAWDGLVVGAGWRYGVEIETLPRDAQALVRRLNLKRRDGDVDGVLLVLPDTRRVRLFLNDAAPDLVPTFPVKSAVALGRLGQGEDPSGSAVVLLPRRRVGDHPQPPGHALTSHVGVRRGRRPGTDPRAAVIPPGYERNDAEVA